MGDDYRRLIACVRPKEGLWNFKSKDYRDIEKVYMLWNNVAMEMNTTVEEIKGKWRLLRMAYLREVEGIKNGNPSTWHLFPELVFLENNIYENVSTVERLNVKVVDVKGPEVPVDRKQLTVLRELEVVEMQTMQEKKKDSNYLFLASLHPFMKNIPDKNKINVRIKILQFLNKYV